MLQDVVIVSESTPREEETPRGHEHQDAKADPDSVEDAPTASKLANAPKGQEAHTKACKRTYEMPEILDVAQRMHV